MVEKHWTRAALALVLAAGCLSASAAAEISGREQDLQRLRAATEIFQTLFQGAGSRVPKTVLQSTQCIAIVPGYKTLAIGVGGAYGKGIAMCRNAPPQAAAGEPAGAAAAAAAGEQSTTPEFPAAKTPSVSGAIPGWSAPIFITIGGASLGPQIGVQSADLVLMFQSRSGLESMLNNKIRLGVSAAAAAGPVGRSVSAETDAALRAQVISYARSRGLFAGVNINGAVIQPDESGNRAIYPHQYWQDVLDGRIQHPAAARPLISELNRSPFTNPAVRAANPGAAAQPALNLGPGARPPLPFEAGIAWNHVTGDTGHNGWDLFGGWRPLRRRVPGFSLVASIARNHGSQTLAATGVTTTRWTVLAGPEFDDPHRLLDPYGHVLFGYGHLSQDVTVGIGNPSPGTTSNGFNSFAWELGGGLKLNLNRRLSIRLVELDLLHTGFNGGGQSHARISIGASVHF